LKAAMFTLLFSTLSFAGDCNSNLSLTFVEQLLSQANQPKVVQVARSGCCSWHGGVCGCSSQGRAVCCDNTL